jgi:hypothetical protein
MREAFREPSPAINLLQQIGDLDAREQLMSLRAVASGGVTARKGVILISPSTISTSCRPPASASLPTADSSRPSVSRRPSR